MWVLQVGPTTHCSLTIRPPVAAFKARLQGSVGQPARPSVSPYDRCYWPLHLPLSCCSLVDPARRFTRTPLYAMRGRSCTKACAYSQREQVFCSFLLSACFFFTYSLLASFLLLLLLLQYFYYWLPTVAAFGHSAVALAVVAAAAVDVVVKITTTHYMDINGG